MSDTKVSNFAAMDLISQENGDIVSAPLTNMVGLNKNRHGWILGIGIDNATGHRLFLHPEELSGALFLVGTVALNDAKKRLTEAQP